MSSTTKPGKLRSFYSGTDTAAAPYLERENSVLANRIPTPNRSRNDRKRNAKAELEAPGQHGPEHADKYQRFRVRCMEPAGGNAGDGDNQPRSDENGPC